MLGNSHKQKAPAEQRMALRLHYLCCWKEPLHLTFFSGTGECSVFQLCIVCCSLGTYSLLSWGCEAHTDLLSIFCPFSLHPCNTWICWPVFNWFVIKSLHALWKCGMKVGIRTQLKALRLPCLKNEASNFFPMLKDLDLGFCCCPYHLLEPILSLGEHPWTSRHRPGCLWFPMTFLLLNLLVIWFFPTTCIEESDKYPHPPAQLWVSSTLGCLPPSFPAKVSVLAFSLGGCLYGLTPTPGFLGF